MRILVGLIHPGQAGGIYVTEKRFLDECANHPDVEITTFLFGSRKPGESRSRRVIRLMLDVVRYAALVKKHKPDIVHLNSAYDRRALLRDFWYALISHWLGETLFIKFHGSDARLLLTDSKFWRFLTRVTFRYTAGIGVLSSEEKGNFVAAGYAPDRFFVLTNVVDWQRFAATTTHRPHPSRILFIARFVPSKGLLHVIQAVKYLVDAGLCIELKCVGDGPEMKQAKALVSRLGLEKQVVFDGWVPEMDTTSYYLESSLLVLPTETEGFSMTIFQAVAAGLPVITTKIRAAGEYLKEPDNCLWIDPRNPQMLAEKIRYLLDHPDVAKRMSENNRKLAKGFPAEKVVVAYLNTYRQIIERRQGAQFRSRADRGQVRVLFNAPNPILQGGPATHLYLLEAKLRKSVQLHPYQYGRRTDTETVADKVIGRMRDLRELRAIIRSFRPDIIHHNSAFDRKAILRDVPLAWLANLYKIPLLVKIHGSHREAFGPVNPFVALLRKSFLRNSDWLGVLSPAERDEFIQAWPGLNDHVVVVKNIIKEDFCNVVRKESVNPTVLFISRFTRKKGMFDLLRSVPKIRQQFPDTEFILIGSGPDVDEFLSEVRELGQEDAVHWIGQVNHLDTTRFYSSAWVFVFPTQYPEGMPMVVAEAMAAGVPIVTTRTRFSLSYMEEEKHCLYIDSGNPDSVAQKVNRLLGDRALREQMSQANRAFARGFDPEIVTDEFLRLYRRILGYDKSTGSSVSGAKQVRSAPAVSR